MAMRKRMRPGRTSLTGKGGSGAAPMGMESMDVMDFDEGAYTGQLERAVDAMRRGVFGGDTPVGELSSQIAADLRAEVPNGPAEAVADAAADAVTSVMAGAKEAGENVDPLVAYGVTVVAVNDIAEAAKALGEPITPEQGVQALMAAVTQVAEMGMENDLWDRQAIEDIMDQVRNTDPGEIERQLEKLDPEGMKALRQDVEQGAGGAGPGPGGAMEEDLSGVDFGPGASITPAGAQEPGMEGQVPPEEMV